MAKVNGTRAGYRESTLESADQAEGIFDLYGPEPGAGNGIGNGNFRQSTQSWMTVGEGSQGGHAPGIGMAFGSPGTDPRGMDWEGEHARARQGSSLGRIGEVDVERRASGSSQRTASARRNGSVSDAGDKAGTGVLRGDALHVTSSRSGSDPLRRSGEGDTEELEDNPDSARSWDGPIAALSNRASAISVDSAPSGLSTGNAPLPANHYSTPEKQKAGTGSAPVRERSELQRNQGSSSSLDQSAPLRSLSTSNTTTSVPSSAPGSTRKPLPTLTVTPDLTPSRRITQADPVRAHSPNPDDSYRLSIISSSTSTTPAGSRLTPRMSAGSQMSGLPGDGPAGMPSAAGGRRFVNGSTSQVSFGSSKYPGEDADAFHVRSTYARLEAEGVHGDGWEAGVERTRGGPAVGRRATLIEPGRGETIGEKERSYLSSLDRYGFVNEPLKNRSETRVALIPVGPLTKIPKLPSSSPLANQKAPAASTNGGGGGSSAGLQPRVPPSPRLGDAEDEKHRRKENERVGKWMGMMGVKRREGGNAVEWSWKADGQTKLTRRVYKGIPDRWRMAAWWTLAEETVANHQVKGKGKGKRPAESLISDYRNTIDLASSFDVQIDLDVPRTISGHTLFTTRYGAGQRSLFHTLHCFSMLCESCGYCQGMGPIAATLLCYFDPERAYALLVRLHDVYGMHEIFSPGFPGLLEAFYVQERLMEWLIPDVYKSFQRNMIASTSWGTKWYITLFVNTVPFSQQLRLWDALWLDGRDVIIMTSIAILWAFKDLLASPSATFESILSLLSSYFVAEDDDHLMRWIKRMLHQPGIKQKMDGWRVDWQKLVREGKDRDALL